MKEYETFTDLLNVCALIEDKKLDRLFWRN